ncbi:competence protein CoiA family protein [Mucilaginibacter sp. MD40]|uniref:competence protein CoiA n=1 Tax=Mucilaginibacter sp. MD40 TaxID=2029590 RepID=UPI00117F7229
MRFAMFDNNRIEAEPGLSGFCPGCGLPLIAKCGTQRMHHWAHRNKMCDPWWEPETEWHRSWKGNFPVEWQEIILNDELTGEKHIADVRTAHGMVIEFQHSRIDPLERVSRENFYGNMVWVADGTRLKREHQRFIDSKDHFFQINAGSFLVSNPEHSLPAAWLGSPVPVIFDFKSDQTFYGSTELKEHVFCLFPIRIGTSALLEKIPVKSFIADALNGRSSLRLRSFLNNKDQFMRDLQNQITMLRRMQQRQTMANFSRPVTYKRRRRY